MLGKFNPKTFFPKCVAKSSPLSLWVRVRCVRLRLLHRLQPFKAVRDRPQQFATKAIWPCHRRWLQKLDCFKAAKDKKWCFVWQAWHFVTSDLCDHVSEICVTDAILFGLRKMTFMFRRRKPLDVWYCMSFASRSGTATSTDNVKISWQAWYLGHFCVCNVRLPHCCGRPGCDVASFVPCRVAQYLGEAATAMR